MCIDSVSKYEQGCIIFKKLGELSAPGVAVFHTDHGDVKRSIYFEFGRDDSITICEFGFDYCAELKNAKEYIQLGDDDAKTLQENGRVTLKKGDFNIINGNGTN